MGVPNQGLCAGGGGGAGVNRVCESCGQQVSADHLDARSAAFVAAVEEAEEAAGRAETALRDARTAVDARQWLILSREEGGAVSSARALAEAAGAAAAAVDVARGSLAARRQARVQVSLYKILFYFKALL